MLIVNLNVTTVTWNMFKIVSMPISNTNKNNHASYYSHLRDFSIQKTLEFLSSKTQSTNLACFAPLASVFLQIETVTGKCNKLTLFFGLEDENLKGRINWKCVRIMNSWIWVKKQTLYLHFIFCPFIQKHSVFLDQQLSLVTKNVDKLSPNRLFFDFLDFLWFLLGGNPNFWYVAF